MFIADQNVLMAVNIAAALLALFSIYMGFRRGFISALLGFLVSVVILAAACFGGWFMAHTFVFVPASWAEKALQTAYGAAAEITPQTLLYARKVMTFLIVFLAVELVLHLITHPIFSSAKKKRDSIGMFSQLLGFLTGCVSAVFWTLALSVCLITSQSAGIVRNGADLVNQSVLQYPVQYIGKPLTDSLKPDVPIVQNLWETGLILDEKDQAMFTQWMQENGFGGSVPQDK